MIILHYMYINIFKLLYLHYHIYIIIFTLLNHMNICILIYLHYYIYIINVLDDSVMLLVGGESET